MKLSLLPLLAAAAAPLALASFVPSHVSRTIDLGGALTRSTTIYTLHHSNDGNDGFTLTFHSDSKPGFVEAHVGKSGSRKLVEIRQEDSADSPQTLYHLTLPTPTSSDPTILTLLTVNSHATVAKPSTLPQTAEAVLMLWSADLLSPSELGLTEVQKRGVEEVKVKVKAPSPRIGEIKAPEGWELQYSKGGATATFLTKGGVSALSEGEQLASLHYAQPEPITTIRSLDRLVEVSHWGNNLAVQDNIDLYNGGPTLQGHFSRLHHQRASMQRRITALSITSLSLALPPNVHSPYYYDIVGNVSTSRFRPSTPSAAAGKLPSQRKGAGYSLLELVPRYPLMGGWNFTFTIGYDAPLGDYLRQKKGGEYSLKVPFLTPVKDVSVEQARVEIRLPEGASNIRVHTPFPVDSLSPAPSAEAELTKTYLDSTGRPTIVMEKKDCSDRHGADVVITYTLSPLRDLLQKPLAVAGVLFIIFLSIIGAKRIDWSIPGEQRKGKKE